MHSLLLFEQHLVETKVLKWTFLKNETLCVKSQTKSDHPVVWNRTGHDPSPLPRAPNAGWSELCCSLVAPIALMKPGVGPLYATLITWFTHSSYMAPWVPWQQLNSFFYVFHTRKTDWLWLCRCSNSKSPTYYILAAHSPARNCLKND